MPAPKATESQTSSHAGGSNINNSSTNDNNNYSNSNSMTNNDINNYAQPLRETSQLRLTSGADDEFWQPVVAQEDSISRNPPRMPLFTSKSSKLSGTSLV